jgi:hypothetical protein
VYSAPDMDDKGWGSPSAEMNWDATLNQQQS